MPRALVFLLCSCTALLGLSVGPDAASAGPAPNGWQVQLVGRGGMLQSVSCPDTGHCWAVGSNAAESELGPTASVILASADGGMTWTSEAAPAGVETLVAVACPDDSHCYAAGVSVNGSTVEPALIGTTDGGASWSAVGLPANVRSIAGLSCPDAAHCALVGQSTTPPGDSGFVPNDGTAVMATTADGGGNWTSQALTVDSASATNSLYGVSCPNDAHCLAVGLENPDTRTPNSAPLVETTADDGATWTGSVATVHASQFDSVSCPDPTDCLAAVGQFASGSVTTAATHDGGRSWAATSQVNTGLALDCPTGQRCWASGGYRSDDFGAHWVADQLAKGGGPPGGRVDYGLSAISCPSVDQCTAVGARAVPKFSLRSSSLHVLVEHTLPGGSFPGYWLVGADGGVFSFGEAGFHGSTGGHRLNAPMVASAATPDGGGYWLVASDGGVFSFGDAPFYGSLAGQRLPAPIVAIVANPDGSGYQLFARNGTFYSFPGDRADTDVTTGNKIGAPVVGASADYQVGADGAVYANYPGVNTFGSMAGRQLTRPIVAMAETPDGGGYWLVGADGGVFSFGDATFHGSTGAIRLNQPIVGMAAPDSGGYWLVAADGGIFSFGDVGFYGSTGAIRLTRPIVGVS